MIQLVQHAALLLGTFSGAITDAKTGYIYDWVTLPMIGVGLVASVGAGMMHNILFASAIFVILYIMYYFGKIGGGDVKLFTGIALLNPYNNINFLASLALFAALGAMLFYSLYYTAKYARKGIKIKENKEGIRHALLLGFFVLAYFMLFYSTGYVDIATIFFMGFPLAAGLVFLAFQNGIKKNFFEKKMKLEELEEDEVISENNPKKVMELFKKKRVFGEKETKELRKKGIKKVVVLRDLPPFGPFIFLGSMAATFFPDIILLAV